MLTNVGMPTSDNVATAKAVFDAYVTKDRGAVERLVAKDFHFTSPLDNRLDRAAYFERCWPNSESTLEFRFVHVVPAGQRVFVTYEAKTKRGTFRNTEILTIENGQVVEVEVYFGWDLPHKAEPGGFVSSA